MLHATSPNEALKAFYLGLNDLLRPRNMELLPDIPVEWSNRLSKRVYARCTGQRDARGFFPQLRILLNQSLFRELPLDRQTLEIQATIRHEAGHAWTAAHCSKIDHGTTWRHIARILGDTGHKFAGCTPAELQAAANNHHKVPTLLEIDDARALHSLRVSFKLRARRLGLPLTHENFDAYVRRRYPQFSPAALDAARDQLASSLSPARRAAAARARKPKR